MAGAESGPEHIKSNVMISWRIEQGADSGAGDINFDALDRGSPPYRVDNPM